VKKPDFVFDYAGSDNINEVAWNSYSGKKKNTIQPALSSGDIMSPQEVGKKKPNQLDIFDMTGNVAEWCSDERNTEPSKGSKKAYRGGAWWSQNREYLVYDRSFQTHDSNEGSIFVGFRCVRSR